METSERQLGVDCGDLAAVHLRDEIAAEEGGEQE
jgi:hypothetical protein